VETEDAGRIGVGVVELPDEEGRIVESGLVVVLGCSKGAVVPPVVPVAGFTAELGTVA
jgi:hypothetical protein